MLYENHDMGVDMDLYSSLQFSIDLYPPMVASAFLSSDLAVSISSNSKADIAHLACFCVCSTCFLVGGAEVKAGIGGAEGGGEDRPSP